jgi:outer membrane protein OmpA-like peptidoglycan-associated protein
LAITPEVTIDYNTLFADPNAGSTALEMSVSGREALAAAVESMGSVRTSLVSVEGYTDPSGDSESNQVESYERAMTARRFLVESLGFDPDRVKAFGMGEQEPVDTSNLSGSAERNRRIVIKVIPGT